VSECMSSLDRQSIAMPLLLIFLVVIDTPIFEGEMFFCMCVSVSKCDSGGKDVVMLSKFDELEVISCFCSG
jgi:hypothetical protein